MHLRPSKRKIRKGDDRPETAQLVRRLRRQVVFSSDTTTVTVRPDKISWTYQRAVRSFDFAPEQDPALTVEQLLIAASDKVRRRRTWRGLPSRLIEMDPREVFPQEPSQQWRLWRYDGRPFIYFETQCWNDRNQALELIRGVVMHQNDLASVLVTQRDWERDRF